MMKFPISLNEWESQQNIFQSTTPSQQAGLPCSNSTRSFWVDSSPDASPLAREGSTGPLTTDADVCITGSGITGVGVAYHLSQTVEMSFLRRETFVRMSPMLPILSTFGW